MMNVLIGLGIGLVAGFIGYSYGLCGSKVFASVEDVQAIKDEYEAIMDENSKVFIETVTEMNSYRRQLEELQSKYDVLEERAKSEEVTEEMMNNAIDHIYYIDRALGEDCEVLCVSGLLTGEPEPYGQYTYFTEDEKYRYTLTESDIARVAIAMKYSDKENIYETISPIVEEILIEQFASMREKDMAKKVISLNKYKNRR